MDPNRVFFVPFVVVAPRRYLEFFNTPNRKTKAGDWIKWDEIRRSQSPRFGYSPAAYLEQEVEKLDMFNSTLKAKQLTI